MEIDYKGIFERLTKRYGGADPQALERVLCPILIPIHNLDKTVIKFPRQTHYRATFSILIDERWEELMQRGQTGKFVPKKYVEGGLWKEIAKGRIIDVDKRNGVAVGEVYTGGTKAVLEKALAELSNEDYLEIDQYGAAAKVLSGLVEYSLSKIVSERGYEVRRMPQDIAKHLGAYYYYDFEFEKEGVVKKVEAKSLWGTNTRYARLIHSKGGGYPTSSCRFDTQDVFAVSLFLRTGNIQDFAFARCIRYPCRHYGLRQNGRRTFRQDYLLHAGT